MGKQALLPITTREKTSERLFFRQPIPKGTILRLRKPDAPNMRRYPAVYVGCGFNHATGRFGVPVRMHWIESSDPRGQNRTIEDRSLWQLYDVSPWCDPEITGNPDMETESAVVGSMWVGFTDTKETTQMGFPRFEIEKHVPSNTVLMPRKPGGMRAIFCGAHQLSDGTWRYSIRRQMHEVVAGQPCRYGLERFVTGDTLITTLDLGPFGWLPVAYRPRKAKTASQQSVVHGLEAQIAELMARLNKLEGKE